MRQEKVSITADMLAQIEIDAVPGAQQNLITRSEYVVRRDWAFVERGEGCRHVEKKLTAKQAKHFANGTGDEQLKFSGRIFLAARGCHSRLCGSSSGRPGRLLRPLLAIDPVVVEVAGRISSIARNDEATCGIGPDCSAAQAVVEARVETCAVIQANACIWSDAEIISSARYEEIVAARGCASRRSQA